MSESFKRAKRKGVFRNIPFNKKKKLDLRQIEEFKNFRAHRYTFHLNGSWSTDITVHNDTKQQELTERHNVVKQLLKESMEDISSQGVSLKVYVHIFLHCDGFKGDFIWNAVGNKAVTLGEILYVPEALDEIIDKFSQTIQSNDNVILDDKTVLQIMVFDPPPQFTKPPRFPYVHYK